MDKKEFNELLNLAFKSRVETIRSPDKELIDKQYNHIDYIEHELVQKNKIIDELKNELSTYREDSDTLTFLVDHLADGAVADMKEKADLNGEHKFYICCDELGEIMKEFEVFLGPFMQEKRKCKDC